MAIDYQEPLRSLLSQIKESAEDMDIELMKVDNYCRAYKAAIPGTQDHLDLVMFQAATAMTQLMNLGKAIDDTIAALNSRSTMEPARV